MRWLRLNREAAASLALCLAALVMRVVSIYHWQVLRLGTGPGSPCVVSSSGKLQACRNAEKIDVGVKIYYPKYGPEVDWFWIAAAFAAWPAYAAVAPVLCRRYRLRRWLCVECGYNIRATPYRCPECGAASEALTMAGVHGVRER